MRSVKAGALVALWIVVAGLPAAAHGQGVDETCVLPLTKTDPATVNVAYPDEGAIYWIGAYQAAPGTRIRITGRYPHARYFSFNVYDNAQRPLDALADVEIAPDAGSTNPFVAGGDRRAANRDYTAFIDFGAIPQKRAPNTLYTGTGQNGAPNFQGTFILRVYVPDKGRDETGGVGLPTLTLEPSDAGGGRPPDSACANFAKPPVQGVNEAVAGASSPPLAGAPGIPGNDPPTWIKFRNLVQVANQVSTDNPYLDSFNEPASGAESVGGNGAFLSNLHNAYVYAGLNRAFGDVSLTRLRAPTFADTRSGTPTMPRAQLRYFSMCTNEIASQRFIGCATDDQSVVGDDGFLNYVVSSPASRPQTATRECGYTWLPFGPSSEASLLLRNMLPDPGFAQAIQRAKPREETKTMGDYMPTTRYLKAGEALPCQASQVTRGPSLGLPGSTSGRQCRGHRRLVIHLRGGLRSASIYVGGRRVRVLRGRRLRSRVELRGLPTGRYHVKVVARTKTGRRVVSIRTYRTCARS